MTPKDGLDELLYQVSRKDISRQDFVKKAALLGVSVPLAQVLLERYVAHAAQSRGEETVTASGSGGTVIAGIVAEPGSMDPGQITDINSMRIHKSIYDGLVDWADSGFTLKPALAESWEISPDQLTYTFHLRKGVRFHDGTPFNAEAVKFNMDRWLNPNNHYHKTTGPFPLIPAYIGAVKETRVVNEYTVQMIHAQPNAAFLPNLTVTYVYMVSPTAVKKYGKAFARNPVGTGPFQFVNWQSNVQSEFKANPHYWGGQPKLDKLIFVPIIEDQSRYTQLVTGQINFAEDLPPDNIALLRRDSRMQVLLQPGPHTWWVTLNTRKMPFRDVRARQAANYAVNKQGIIHHLLKDTGKLSTGPVPPAIAWAHTDKVQNYPYDPEKARALLKATRVPHGTQLLFLVPISGSGMQSPRPMAEAIQSSLAAVGLTAKIATYEWETYISRYGSGLGNADMGELSWMVSSGDPDLVPRSTLASWNSSPAGFNAGYYHNARVDELFRKALLKTSHSYRAPIYYELQQIVAREAPWIFVDNGLQNVTVSTQVHGFQLHPSFLFRFHNTWVG